MNKLLFYINNIDKFTTWFDTWLSRRLINWSTCGSGDLEYPINDLSTIELICLNNSQISVLGHQWLVRRLIGELIVRRSIWKFRDFAATLIG